MCPLAFLRPACLLACLPVFLLLCLPLSVCLLVFLSLYQVRLTSWDLRTCTCTCICLLACPLTWTLLRIFLSCGNFFSNMNLCILIVFSLSFSLLSFFIVLYVRTYVRDGSCTPLAYLLIITVTNLLTRLYMYMYTHTYRMCLPLNLCAVSSLLVFLSVYPPASYSPAYLLTHLTGCDSTMCTSCVCIYVRTYTYTCFLQCTSSQVTGDKQSTHT